MAQLKFDFPQDKKQSIDEKMDALDLGRVGEQLAANYLVDKGYIILEHNYHRGHLEIDLIALDNDELVIVEVKTRSDDEIMQPEDAVDHKKRLSLIRLANQYVMSNGRTENVRFDIVSVISNDDTTEIRHLKDAYNVMSF